MRCIYSKGDAIRFVARDAERSSGSVDPAAVVERPRITIRPYKSLLMEENEVLRLLMDASRSFEGYSVQRFMMYRETKAGTTQRVDVDVLDAGEGETNRYSIHARADDGKTASGNPDKNLAVAIAMVHWGNLG